MLLCGTKLIPKLYNELVRYIICFISTVYRDSAIKTRMELDEMDRKNMNWYVETRKKALASSNSDTLVRLRKEWEEKEERQK